MASISASLRAGGASGQGIACILFAILLFSAYGALTKWLAGE